MFPRLKDGGTKVTYEASGQSPVHAGPSQYLAEPLRRQDLEKDGFRVYQLQAAGPIRFASGAGRVTSVGPWSVEFSLDGGKTWQTGIKDVKTGGEGKQWEDGRAGYVWAEMQFPKNGTARDVLVRFGKGEIAHAQVFATYESRNSSPLVVTYGWLEGEHAKQHVHEIPAGKTVDAWTVPTGQDVKTKWVRFEAK